jgi:excisionase family DNA binding protein
MTVPRSLTPMELARRWRCDVKRVRAMVRAGQLAAIRIGTGLRITPEAIEAAERGPLAVKPAVRKAKSERVSRRAAEILARA